MSENMFVATNSATTTASVKFTRMALLIRHDQKITTRTLKTLITNTAQETYCIGSEAHRRNSDITIRMMDANKVSGMAATRYTATTM
jgi:hypothetical protein